MKKIITISMILLTILSTFAILSSNMKAISPQFQFEPLIESPMDDGHPYILQDSTNKVWVFFGSNRTDNGHQHIFYVTSVDGGNTWSDVALFLPAFTPGLDVFYNPVAFQDSTGRIWVAWLNHMGPNADQVWFTTSSDGENWTSAKLLCGDHNDMGGFIETEDTVWFFFSPMSTGWRISYKTTDDGGQTWSGMSTITSEYGLRVPHATVLSNGTIFVVYKTGMFGGVGDVGYSASSDGGMTWSNGIVDDPPDPQWDDTPRVVEDNNDIYVFFGRSYTQEGYEWDVWFRVWNETIWEDPQRVTDGSINECNNDPTPLFINNQLWIVFQTHPYRERGPLDRGIWLAKTGEIAVVPATIDINPDTLNLKSEGEFITAYIELPEGYDVADIDLSTVQLEGIPAITGTQYGFVTDSASYLMDHDGDGILEHMVKFDRSTVRDTLTDMVDYEQGVKFYELTLTITGELVAGTPFKGTDTITVIKK